MTYGPSTVNRPRRTKAELAELDGIIVNEVEANAPMTLRSAFYRCVSVGAVAKTEAAYATVGQRLLMLRRCGRVPYSSIVDGTRSLSTPPTWSSPDELLQLVASNYRRKLWDNQGVKVLLITEKDAISSVVKPVTDEYDVRLGVARGYASETFARVVALDVADADCPVFVYQLGDHDPSGLDAWRDLCDKVTGFAPDADVTFARLAVTPEQILEMGLQTRPTKRSDSRARSFDGESVEVDAIAPPVLRQLLTDAIESHIDWAAYDLTREAEQTERDELMAMVRHA